MPIKPPVLDDRGFDDLVQELVARIPAHTPEWTHPRPGDPGRTLLELFAWLGDALLYRVNFLPERQRLAFLRLVGGTLRPAEAARTLVSLSIDNPAVTRASTLRPGALLKGPVPFETRGEVTVLPVTAQAYVKRPLEESERAGMREVLDGLRSLYRLGTDPVPYVTTPVFAGGAAEQAGVDLMRRTVDGSLWLALLAPAAAVVDDVRDTLGGDVNGAQRVLNVGVAPAVEVPERFGEEVGLRGRIPLVWEITTGATAPSEPRFAALDVAEDTTGGLARRGVVRLVLPGRTLIGAPADDVRANLDAGVGDAPPRLDAPDDAERLVAWVRLRPRDFLHALRLSWVGVNAVEADARQTVAARVVAVSDGSPDQEVPLGATQVDAGALELEVEAEEGYAAWTRVDALATAERDDTVFELDAEAGTVRFGDGVRGRIPEEGRRIRVRRMRAGGGAAGNLPAGTLTKVTGQALEPGPLPALKVLQPLPAQGGEDAERLEQAERRIPAWIRHQDRAVTADDFRRLAGETPGVRVGRVEVLPRFKPQQRRPEVPGVVSVMVLPHKDVRLAPNPRPDRPFLEAVHAHLDARRPLTTELYVIGCEYVPLGLSTAIRVRDGWAREAVVQSVRDALRAALWPLEPGGAEERGWPLGTAVREREMEVVVARVPGVAEVAGVNLFGRQREGWVNLRTGPGLSAVLPLEPWQLPELLSVVVALDEAVPETLAGAPNPFGGWAGPVPGGGTQPGTAVPVVPEVC
ncbi:MAG TPA: putative baseplate assembly protein [Longimicrobium sp.]|uniref:putative baseplate assembly protein n=1 Tax=Longimicrobium sp. TaxID=2029185 RepID=UPI002ED7F3A7